MELKVCARDPEVEEATQKAIDMWNGLVPTTGNCEGCLRWEDPTMPTGKHHAESVLIHELGHCAFGLDHIERWWGTSTTLPSSKDGVSCIDAGIPCQFPSSFTRSAEADHILQNDAFKGNEDDTHSGIGGGGARADAVAYYLKGINDPVTLSGGMIDNSTYLRSVSSGNLPAGHTWAVSANVEVANEIGFANTQSVMYGRAPALMKYSSLTQDDVNMRKLAMTGDDRTFGTADDYTMTLTYVGDCSNSHDLEVALEDELFDNAPGAAGVCGNFAVDLAPTSPPRTPLNAITYSVVKRVSSRPLLVQLNPARDWDFGEAPDMSVTKTNGGLVSVDPDDLITYTISVANNGRKDATGVVLTETVPFGTTFDESASLPSVWSCPDGSAGGTLCEIVIGPFGKVDPVANFTFAVVVDMPATTVEVSNTVSVVDDGTNGFDETPADNSFTLTTPITIPCNGTTDLVLTSPVGDPVIVHEACNSITAGTAYNVFTGRDVSFHARNLIALTDGFSVENGAAFSAAIDPLAGQ